MVMRKYKIKKREFLVLLFLKRSLLSVENLIGLLIMLSRCENFFLGGMLEMLMY